MKKRDAVSFSFFACSSDLPPFFAQSLQTGFMRQPAASRPVSCCLCASRLSYAPGCSFSRRRRVKPTNGPASTVGYALTLKNQIQVFFWYHSLHKACHKQYVTAIQYAGDFVLPNLILLQYWILATKYRHWCAYLLAFLKFTTTNNVFGVNPLCRMRRVAAALLF